MNIFSNSIQEGENILGIILISTRYKEIQEDSQTHRDNHFSRKFKETGNHNQPRFGECFHVSHLATSGAESSLKTP